MATAMLVTLFVYSGFCYAHGRQSVLSGIRGLHSLLDLDVAQRTQRIVEQHRVPASATPVPARPSYLRTNDRVLLLNAREDDGYWLFEQSVYWNELYAEAFALHEFGHEFLVDRENYFAIFDWQRDKNRSDWFRRRGVTLIVDQRSGASEYFDKISRHWNLNLKQIAEGVWRLEK